MSLYAQLDAAKDIREAENIGRAIRNWRKRRQKTLGQALEEGEAQNGTQSVKQGRGIDPPDTRRLKTGSVL